MGATVQALVDRAEILECLNRYARGMDRHDREMVRSSYHEGAIDVHGSQAFGVEDFIDWAFAYHEPQLHHQHHISNVTIDVHGEVATWTDSSASADAGRSRRECARPNGGPRPSRGCLTEDFHGSFQTSR